MTFAVAGLECIDQAPGGEGVSLWRYTHATEAHGDVDATDYFAGMGKGTASGTTNRGMKVGDIVFVRDVDTATGTMHFVTAVDSEGNVTIGAATLS